METEKRYVVRNKHTWEPLATYTDKALCWAEWFDLDTSARKPLYIPRGEIIVTTEGGKAEDIARRLQGR